jgi:type I restriction-modification system DNA methylase subunit
LLGYAHHILRAFHADVLGITGVLCVDSRPTIYFRRDDRALSWAEANRLHRTFWNQGIATLLILADPERLRVYSARAKPVQQGSGEENPPALIDALLDDVADLLELERLLHEVASGQFYHDHADRFEESQAVDDFLLQNLAAARDLLTTGAYKLKEEAAHALLGRLTFLCYLTDRKVIAWSNYEREVGRGVENVRQLLETYDAEEGLQRLYSLFERLQHVFNGSMFDQNLKTEARRLKPPHYEVLRKFFSVGEVATGQATLGFWAYDFSVIPVETISAIYEDFLCQEDAEGKRKEGAYYTPRHLAEMVVDIAIAGDPDWAKRRYLDAAVGSGVFLVTLFNRLASKWVFDNYRADYCKRAAALFSILHDQLRGVDIERTACRIACFSLYLAFLDQFEPREIREFARLANRSKGKILPKLLRYRDSRWSEHHAPTIMQGDFLKSDMLTEKFDYLVGNPPWSGRGTKQKAWEFMRHAPKHLHQGARGCLLLPAKVLFNRTEELQRDWFSEVMVERIVNLSDFSFILFEHAKCPALIVRFSNQKPAEGHRFQYDTPKVTGTDCRDGVITILPHDRRRLQQSDLFAAIGKRQSPSFWKRHFSGTPRDWKLLDLLDDMPKLGRLTCTGYRAQERRTRWLKGQGVQPDSRGKCVNPQSPWWREDRLFLSAQSDAIQMFVFHNDCEPVGRRFPRLYFARHPDLFEPPLVLISQGFGKVAFCDFPVLFQHSLQSITPAAAERTAREADSDLLVFLTVYLRSRLASYYLFHTAAIWGVERDKVLLLEMLHLPFPIAGDAYAHPEADRIVSGVATATKALRDQLGPELTRLHQERKERRLPIDSEEFGEMLAPFNEKRRADIDALQSELEREIYNYFDLTDEEVALVEDTIRYVEPSSTPRNRESILDGGVPNLLPTDRAILREYAAMVTGTLNEWAEGGHFQVEASAAQFEDRPFVLFHLRQTRKPRLFRLEKIDHHTQAVLERIYDAARQKQGRFDYPRTVTFFDGESIYLLKPNSLMHWTRTAALNDADEIFAEVIRQRRAETA